MPVEPNKVTDADVMGGFNPVYGLSAEEIEKGEIADAGTVPGAEVTPESGKVEAANAPTLVEVELDGRKFQTPKETAEAFNRAISKARDTTAGTRGSELQSLRERLAKVEGATAAATATTDPAKPVGLQPPNPELAIENPAEHQRQMIEYVDAKQTEKIDKIAAEYRAAEDLKALETARVNAWGAHCDAFYAKPENAILRDNRDIVDLVLEANKTALAPLSVEDGFTELGRLVKERLARLTGPARTAKVQGAAKPPVLEGSNRRESAVAPPAEDEGPRSLTEALKARRKAAADGFAKGGSGRPGASR